LYRPVRAPDVHTPSHVPDRAAIGLAIPRPSNPIVRDVLFGKVVPTLLRLHASRSLRTRSRPVTGLSMLDGEGRLIVVRGEVKVVDVVRRK
jgi:hypothetical protein